MKKGVVLTTPRGAAKVWKTNLFAEQMLDDVLVERLVIPVGDHLARLGFIVAARFLHELEEGAAAVVEMREPMLNLGGAERMHVEADVFAVAAVFVFFQHEIGRA